jgi:tetratricopeptide (TPR) repeat protein
MPKKRAATISHSALTNHRIVARPDEPLPEAAYRQTTASLPDLVHVSADPTQPPKPIAPVVLLHAYADLIAHFPQYQKAHDDLLAEFAKSGTRDTFVLGELARQCLHENTPASLKAAEGYLTESLEEGSTEATDYEMLANILTGSGRSDEGIELLKKGIALNPYSIRLYKTLAVQYIKIKDYNNALGAMKREVEVFPQDSLMRSLVKKVETGGN